MAKAKQKTKKRPAKKTPAKKKPARKQVAARTAAPGRKTKPAKQRSATSTRERKSSPPSAVPEEILSGDSLANLAADLFDALGDDGEGALGGQPSRIEVGGRDAIHVELGAKLASMRGDATQERAAISSAIESFMQLAIAGGLEPNASAYSARCPEFFWEGDGANPPVYARVPEATHDEIGRWFKLIIEGVRAYDTRVGAMSPT